MKDCIENGHINVWQLKNNEKVIVWTDFFSHHWHEIEKLNLLNITKILEKGLNSSPNVAFLSKRAIFFPYLSKIFVSWVSMNK